MSSTAPSPGHFDFWEFVTCAVCHLHFLPEPGAHQQVPFWLTECGHVVCNSHLNPDQSCPQCRESGIQMAPLQRDLDPPLSDWFRSLPSAIDRIAVDIKFQQEAMGDLVRYYRSKCQHHRNIIDKLLTENKILKRENVDLRRYIDSDLTRSVGEPSEQINPNGKRPLTGVPRGQTSSSPHLVVTPLAPRRLTIPSAQQPPSYSTHHRVERSSNTNMNSSEQSQDRPGTSHLQRFAYVPQTPQFDHYPRPQARSVQDQSQHKMMPPPPPQLQLPGQLQSVPAKNPSNSREASNIRPHYDLLQEQNKDSHRMRQIPPQTTTGRQDSYAPPKVPSMSTAHLLRNPQRSSATSTRVQPADSSRRLDTPSFNQSKPDFFRSFKAIPQTPSGVHRFVPVTFSTARTSLQAEVSSHTSQKMPYVPDSHGEPG